MARTDGGVHRFDAVVVASGALLMRLTRGFGVRGPVQAGRGYSFSVPAHHVPAGPIYLPEQRHAASSDCSAADAAGTPSPTSFSGRGTRPQRADAPDDSWTRSPRT